jgi:two-component system nitrate/nitrite response regulator NarL
MKKVIKLMLVEDHPEYRETMAMALEKESDIELTSQFGTAEAALRSLQNMATRKVPDLILLDLNLPGMTGIEAIPFLAQSIPNIEIVVLTQSNREADVLAAIQAGAKGYLLKKSSRHQIFDCVRTVMAGGALIDPNVATYILNTFKARPPKTEQKTSLSERETEILVLLGEGLVQKQIASHLGISLNTVGSHLRHIYEKLKVQNAPAAIGKAYRDGILPAE